MIRSFVTLSSRKTGSGTQFALGVAALFAASCDSPSPAAKPETAAKTAPSTEAKKADSKTAVAGKASGVMPAHKPADPAAKTVNCLGIHECKGKSACHVKDGHACAGQNDCKGKGWIVVPEAECESKGGKVVEI